MCLSSIKIFDDCLSLKVGVQAFLGEVTTKS